MTKLVSAAVLAFALALPASAFAKGALDGKTFSASTGEKGKTKAEPDTLTFKDGKFHSSGCDPYGFGDGAYTTKTEGGVTTFESDTVSAKEGKDHWKGTVKGNAIEGTMVWTKTGQAPIEYWFRGTLK
jgi:hypothetical protein